MMDEFKTKVAVASLVPHKGKMLLLDRICNYDLDRKSITSEIDISCDSMFYDKEFGGVPVWVAFEFMAQSISALSGICARAKALLNGRPSALPKLGFVVSVHGFEAEIPAFKAGKTVTVWVQETTRVDEAVTFEGCASVGGVVAVTARINTVEVEK